MKQHFRSQAVALSLSALLITGVTTYAFAATTPSTTPPSVVAFNQKLAGGHVLVDYAYLPEKGYAVVYGADKDGKPIPQTIGHVELAAGDHRKFKIKLDQTPPAGSKLWVSLYLDKDAKPGFNAQADASIWGEEIPNANQIVVQ